MQPVFMSPMEREVREASCSGWPETEGPPTWDSSGSFKTETVGVVS